MGTEPLLTQKEEIELSEKIKRYEARVREIKTLLSKLSKEGIGKRNGKEKRLKRMKRLDALIKAFQKRQKG